ncbi:MAG: aminopeptidase [Bacteroidales bacterium]|jgi:aminopeptidase C|nr:aminopeptidase [Bacteroidales bacterium]
MRAFKTIVATFSVAVLSVFCVSAQNKTVQKAKTPDYEFTTVKENPITPIKNQYRSGTCWCFSTIGFLESEVIRLKGIKDTTMYPDLSEMFVVSKSYHDRAVKYVRLDGKLNFGAGSEADDVLDVIREYGIVPQSAQTGLNYGTDLPVHNEMDAALAAYVGAIAKNPNKTLTTAWLKGYDGILSAYLGECPENFTVDGKSYTPESYRDYLDIKPDDYVTLTSFTHHPFYKTFAIEVADNWRWDSAYNVPLDDFIKVLDNAINKGYTVAWGSDVSEKGFTRNGIAVLLPDSNKKSGSDQEHWTGKVADSTKKATLPVEMTVTQESRQKGFDNKQTTDDHGMQIFGIAKDQNGNKYYMVKNSWGETGKYKGIWYASEAFVRAKSMDIMINKSALPKDIAKKLGIK